jgi:hypothetical protein
LRTEAATAVDGAYCVFPFFYPHRVVDTNTILPSKYNLDVLKLAKSMLDKID